MKRLFLLLALVLPLFASAQHQRRVLIEEFTNASCGPCAAQNPAFHATLEANFDKVTPVKYQVNFPGFDPMNVQTQAEVGPRRTYYNISGVPDGFANGTLPLTNYDGTPAQGLSYFNNTRIDAAYNTLTPVKITMSHSLSPNYDSVYVTVAVTSDAALTGDLRLRVAVLENTISFLTPPGSNGETEFYWVMRKMLPGVNGTTTGDFAAGETKTYNLAWKAVNIYNLNQIEVAAWLQNDATKEVLQSEHTIPLNNVPDVGMKLDVSPSALSRYVCSNAFTPSFAFVNTADSALTSVNLRYRLGANGAWNDYVWTGNVAPGNPATLTLPEVTFGTGINQSYTVEILSSNTGIQTNQVSPGVTVNVLTFTQNLPMPVSATFQTGSFTPTGWGIINVTNGWELKTNAGAGGSTRSAMINFYDLAEGNVVDLIMPRVDMSAVQAAKLSYDYAYAYYQGSNGAVFTDTFQIDVSTDCGTTWTNLYKLGGADLATAPPTSGSYSPTAAQWVNKEFDMTPFAGQGNVFVRFRGISGFGNNFYIDNINLSAVSGTVTPLPLSEFALQPNPARSESMLRFGLENAQSIQLLVFNSLGALVHSQNLGDLPAGLHQVELNAASLPAGSYRVALQGRDGVAQKQWVVLK